MPDRRWLQYTPLVGVIILILVSGLIALQHERNNPVNKGERVTAEPPSQKEEGKNQASDNNRAAADSTNGAGPLNNEGAAEPPRGPRRQATEQREKDDLIAQQSMARGTNSLVSAAWWQFGLGVIGVGLVALTARYAYRAAKAAESAVVEGRKATNAAEQAVAVTDISAKRHQRAYVSLKPGKAFIDKSILVFEIIQENHGQTPAKNVKFSCRFSVLPFPLPEDAEFAPPDFGPERKVIAPGQNFPVWRPYHGLGQKSIAEWEHSKERLFVMAVLKYEDIFGDDRETTACWSYPPERIGDVMYYFWSDTRTSNKPVEIPYNYADRHNDAT